MCLQKIRATSKELIDVQVELKTLLGPLNIVESGTVDSTLSMLIEKKGGAIIVLCHDAVKKSLRFNELDNGALSEVFQSLCPNVNKHPEEFRRIMQAFRHHTHSDRWEYWLLKELSDDLGFDTIPPLLLALQGQPRRCNDHLDAWDFSWCSGAIDT